MDCVLKVWGLDCLTVELVPGGTIRVCAACLAKHPWAGPTRHRPIRRTPDGQELEPGYGFGV